MAETNLRDFLVKLYHNYHILKEREANCANAAPIDLLNQIDDYKQAIDITEQAIEQDTPLDELQNEFRGFNLQIDAIVFVAQEPPHKPFTGQNPYRGLRKFTEDEAEFFFGRDVAIQNLLDIVQYLVDTETSQQEPHLIAVLGASGSGKSSLVRAGLIPALRAGEAISGSNQWPVAVMQPGPRPLESLTQSLVPHLARGLPAIQDDLSRSPVVLHQLMLEALADQPDETIFVLVVDQFEELFTQTKTEIERQSFLEMVLHAAHLGGNRSLIILTMRADFYAWVGQYKALTQVITQHQLLVAPMDERELREAILRPAEAVGLELDKGLEERLVRDTLDQPGSLPLLQHVLLELYNHREENAQRGQHYARLTTAAYQQIGGVQGALTKRADTILNNMTPEQQELARDIFLRLISLGDGATVTRRRVTRTELYPSDVAPVQVDTVLKMLTDKNARLVVTDQNSVEVTHEALIQRWDTLQRWLNDNRESLQIHRHLTEASVAWDRLAHDPGELYRGARLAQAQEWQNQQKPRLTALEADFLQASIDAVETEAAQRRRNRQIVIGIAATLAIVIIDLLGIGLWLQSQNATEQANLRSTAEAEADRAERQADAAATAQSQAETEAAIAISRQLAVQSQSEGTRRPQRGLLLALESLNATFNQTDRPSVAARQALRDAALKIGGIPLSGHGDTITVVAFSPDGRWLVTGSGDSTARLWDVKEPTAPPIILSGHSLRINAVAFSPDGRWLITGSGDSTARLWDMEEPTAPPIILSGHDSSINAVAFSPNSRWLVTGSGDSTVQMWDMEEPTAPPIALSGHVSGHESWVNAVAFSPDGRWLVTGSGDSTVRLWDMEEPTTPPITFSGQEDVINAVVFSPDGRWLVAGSGSIFGADTTAQLWNMEEPTAPPVTLSGHVSGHESWVNAVAFSPDGRWLATGSADTTARLWDMDEPTAPPIILSGHESWVNAVAFSPDGRWLVTGSADTTARLWDMEEPTAPLIILSGHVLSINAVAFSPDGKWLVTGSGSILGDNNIAQLWDMEEPTALPITLSGHEDPVSIVVFSPNGRWLVTSSRSIFSDDHNTARLWDMEELTSPPIILSGHKGPINAVAFSPDGKWLVIGSSDNTARLWDMEEPTVPPIALSGHDGWIYAVAFSPDGRWLVTGSADRTARLWDMEEPTAPPITLSGHEGPIYAVAFSPDGQWLVTGSGSLVLGRDSTARLWDMEEPTVPTITLSGDEGRSTIDIAFSPDGRWLVTISADNTVRLWDMKEPTALPITFSNFEDAIKSMAFSPDGKWLVIGSSDNTARLWDMEEPTAPPITLSGHDGSITAVAFSPNGQWLVTGSADTTVRLWDMSLDRQMAQACALAGRNFSQAEWQQFFPGQLYRVTCENWPPGR